MNALKTLLLAILSLTPAFAAPPPYRETGAGLRTILTTGAVRVVQGRVDFRAAMAVTNLSRVELAFNLNGGEMNGNGNARFVFRLQNAAGEIVWQSDPRVETPASRLPYEVYVLQPRTTWQQVAVVPLVVDSAPLSPGRYRLSAYLPNNGDVSAQTLLEVVPPAPAERQMQGVTGVVQRSRSSLERDPAHPDLLRTSYVVEPVAGIRIEARRGDMVSPTSFVAAVSDGNGAFALALEPGAWTLRLIDPTPVAASETPVTVTARQWTDKGIFWVVDDEVPTPNGASGVSGLVTAGPIDPVSIIVIGPNGAVIEAKDYVEVPGWGFEDPRALVRSGVVKIRKGGTSEGTFPVYVWTGVTDEFGRFSAPLPPGEYLVDVLTAFAAEQAAQTGLGGFQIKTGFGTGRASFIVKEGRTMRVRPSVYTGIQ